MKTFFNFKPNALNRIRWINQGHRVFCSDCWRIGLDFQSNQLECVKKYDNLRYEAQKDRFNIYFQILMIEYKKLVTAYY